MINKIVGYSGFKSYSEHPYSTVKQGKDLERTNKVWEDTARQVDHVKPLENYHNNKTVYKSSFIENTHPEHYHPQHVPKGGARTLDFGGAGSIKAYDKEEAVRYGSNGFNKSAEESGDPRKNKLLKTGTEHWGSIYKQQQAPSTSTNNKNAFDSFGHSTGFGRSCSVGGKSQQQAAEEAARAKSYKNRPYINNAKMQPTEFKFNFGEKVGSSPMDLLTRVSVKQPLRDHPLKRGTNQLWTQIPNYQGFKPSELSFKQIQTKIEARSNQNKGNLKLQTTQNFLIHPPGYAGYKPQFQKAPTKLRESCLKSGDC